MGKYIAGDFFTVIDRGNVRPTNEDYAEARLNAFGQVFLLVADGMGGKAKGDYASKYMAKNLANDFFNLAKEFTKPKQFEKWLYKEINKYNRDLYKKAKENPAFKGMGTTLTIGILFSEHLITAQVGDSRLYWVKKNKLEQLTADQSYVNYLVSRKKITPEEAKVHKDRHKLTNAVGVRYNVMVDFKTYEYNNENILVCSDGLYNNVPAYDIESILKSKDSAERKCYQLISFGNANGGSDNMAVVIWESKK